MPTRSRRSVGSLLDRRLPVGRRAPGVGGGDRAPDHLEHLVRVAFPARRALFHHLHERAPHERPHDGDRPRCELTRHDPRGQELLEKRHASAFGLIDRRLPAEGMPPVQMGIGEEVRLGGGACECRIPDAAEQRADVVGTLDRNHRVGEMVIEHRVRMAHHGAGDAHLRAVTPIQPSHRAIHRLRQHEGRNACESLTRENQPSARHRLRPPLLDDPHPRPPPPASRSARSDRPSPSK